jgi:hypothetical protein
MNKHKFISIKNNKIIYLFCNIDFKSKQLIIDPYFEMYAGEDEQGNLLKIKYNNLFRKLVGNKKFYIYFDNDKFLFIE